MTDVTTMHNEAMKLYDSALAARRSGDEQAFNRDVLAALEAESGAARIFADELGLEPTRSVLFRSAATIAMTAGVYDKALELSAAGLAALSVSPSIRAELVALVKEANYRLNVCATDGVRIGTESIVMSLEGGAVGNGMVRHDVFKAKLSAIVNIINRTADRISGVAFGEARSREFTSPLFVSPPIPGSFAIEVRLGDQRQPELDGFPQAVEPNAVLEEVVDCFEAFKNGDLDVLRRRMTDDEYFTNFMALGRALQPDGSKITSVELVGNLHSGIKRVRITTPRLKQQKKRENQNTAEIHEITGVLRVAEKRDEGKERVEIIDDRGKWHAVHVPSALMNDVVRPLWDARVTVTGRIGKRNVLELETIDPA
jgi:hypothetical protein